jgi:hypothetical protein
MEGSFWWNYYTPPKPTLTEYLMQGHYWILIRNVEYSGIWKVWKSETGKEFSFVEFAFKKLVSLLVSFANFLLDEVFPSGKVFFIVNHKMLIIVFRFYFDVNENKTGLILSHEIAFNWVNFTIACSIFFSTENRK